MIRRALTFFLIITGFHLHAQDSISVNKGNPLLLNPGDADSTYIRQYKRKDDIRLIYGGQGSNISFGTINEGNSLFNNALYNNVNDLVGFGLTYKFIDFDLTFSLPKVYLLDEERQNLSQFKLAYSYTMRKLAIRGYIAEAKGVIAQDTKKQSSSDPDIHLVKAGVQVTYYFNFKRYSYRAANFQNELQKTSAGSFLLRAEPFIRSLGMETAIIPTEASYGNQAGLEYVKTGGLMTMPGYGYNFSIAKGKYFISPIIFVGPGLTFNTYRADDGKHSYVNIEYAGSFVLNVGYNGPRMYATLRGVYEAGYFKLDPSYFTTSDIKISLTVGVRFTHFERFIPESLF